MALIDSIVGGMFATFLAFLIARGVSWLTLRNRIEAGIIADITSRISDIKETAEYVEKLFEQSIIENSRILYSGNYTYDEYEYYHSIIERLPLLFKKEQLIKIVKLYQALHEFDAIAGGFMSELTKWRDAGRMLSKDDVDFLIKKKDRIVALKKIICLNQIKTINELPADYQARISAPDIIIAK